MKTVDEALVQTAKEAVRVEPTGERLAADGGPRAVGGVVLAGVHSWAKSGFDACCPRPLLPVLGRPLIGHVLSWLGGQGVERVTVCANSDTAALQSRLGDGSVYGLSLNYYADVMPRGPAGCLRDAMLAMEEEHCVVSDATTVTRLDVADLMRRHWQSGAALTMVLRVPEGAPRTLHSLEPVGIYVASRAAAEEVSPHGYQDIKEALVPRLNRCGLHVEPYVIGPGEAMRVSSPETYMALCASLVAGAIAAEVVSGGYRRLETALVHERAVIEPGARISGPVVIGPDCRVRKGAALLGPVSLGAGCEVAAQAVVSGSFVWDGCRIGEQAYVDRCVLVSRSQVQAGLVLRKTVWLGERGSRRRRAAGAEAPLPVWPADLSMSSEALPARGRV